MADCLPTYYLESIDITLSDDSKNIKKSVAEISDKKQFIDGNPISGGLYDAALGTINNKDRCHTCVNFKDKCPGHMGHIKIETPTPIPLFEKYIIKFMKLICQYCGRFILSYNRYIEEGKEKVTGLDNILKSMQDIKYKPQDKKKSQIKCDHCNKSVGLLESISDNIYVKFTPHNDKTVLFGPDEQLVWLSRVPQNDYDQFKISIRAEKLFFSILMVIPNRYRYDPNNKNKAHELTSALDKIIASLSPNSKGDNMKYQNDIYKAVLAYIKQNNNNSETKDLSSLLNSLTSKKGSIRNNMLGKVIEKVSRSVIVCYPTGKLDVVKISKSLASQLTVKVTVNAYNYDLLSKLYENRNEYPGIPFIYKKSMNFEQTSNIGIHQLEIGDKVSRHLLDGDDICFGRQPSLWAECMLRMRAKIVDYDLPFAFNILICQYFNADYDGDQMTVYIADSEAVRSEMEILMGMENHFISNEKITPWLGQEQDTIVGCALLTLPGNIFKRSQVHKFFSRTTIEKLVLDKDMYTGREIIELLIPPINYESTSKLMSDIPPEYIQHIDPKEKFLKIKNGKYLQGIMDATSIKNKKANTIYHVIYKEYGVKKTIDVIFNMQQVINEFLQHRGFSISINNFLLSKESRDKINLAKQSVIQESIEFSRKLDNGELEAPYGKTMKEFFEMSQVNILQKVNNMIKAPLLESFDILNNDLFLMIFSGSKGNMSNLNYLMGGVMQITNLDQRVREKLAYGDTMPWYQKHSYDPMAKGFVYHSIVEGFQLKEMYAQAEKSRNDIITKGLTVAVAGTKSRVSGKSLDTTTIDNRNFVVVDNKIISLVPNENIFDYKHFEQNKLPWVKMSDQKFQDTYLSNLKEYNEKLIKIRNKYRELQFIRESINLDKFVSDTFLTCVNINRLVDKYKVLELDDTLLSSYESKYNLLFDYCKNGIHRTFGNWTYNEHIKKSLRLFKYTLYFELNPNIMKHIRYQDLRFLINEIDASILKAITEPGCALGTLVTQSIMAPVTQFLIDAHHKSASGGSKTEAIKELDNILVANVEKNIKIKDNTKKKQKKKKASDLVNEIIQIMYIFLKPEYEKDESKFKQLINEIEHIKLNYFAKKTKIKFGSIKPEEPIYKNIMDVDKNITKNMFTNVYYDIELDKDKILNKNITPQEIASILIGEHDAITVFSGSINDDEPRLLIHIENVKTGKINDYEKWVRNYVDVILDTKIKGLSGIASAKIYSLIRSEIKPDGSIDKKAKSYYIRTTGINMDDILDFDEIDPDKIFCNNITIMQSYFGIIACRKRIIAQLEFILSELEIGHPNYLLYGDIITYTGNIININEHGISEFDPDNFLLRTSAKGPLKVIKQCALDSVHNKITGISAPLMMGKSPDLGSYYNKIVVNTDFVKLHTKTVDNLFD
jgi:DNA-directed RNA polymerase II subunit RPB1